MILTSQRPTFLDFHSIDRFTEDDLKKSQMDPRDGYATEHGQSAIVTFSHIT